MDKLERLDAFKEVLRPGVEFIIYTLGEWASSNAWVKELRRKAKLQLRVG